MGDFFIIIFSLYFSELMSAIETNADIFSDANQTRVVLASKGKRNKKPCTVLPVLCHLLDRMPSATQCRRGEVRERERERETL